MIVLMPIIGDRVVPARIKGGLAVLVAFVIFPSVPADPQVLSFDFITLFFKMISEIMIGAILGFTVRLIFSAVELAGQLVGFQMGLAVANVIDPDSSSQVSIVAQFQYIIAVLLYLSMNGHHALFLGMADSFKVLPLPGGFQMSGPLYEAVMASIKDMFSIALKIGAPIIAVLLFMSVGLGLVARTVPQINIFIVAIPLQIAVGLITTGLSMPIIASVVGRCFGDIENCVHHLLRLM